VNNFNDFGSACVTLFELLVVNNWQVLMGGFVAVRGTQARVFFITFYTIAVVMVLNLIVAFVLDAFFRKEEQQRQVWERLQLERDASARRAEEGEGSSSAPSAEAEVGGVGIAAPAGSPPAKVRLPKAGAPCGGVGEEGEIKVGEEEEDEEGGKGRGSGSVRDSGGGGGGGSGGGGAGGGSSDGGATTLAGEPPGLSVLHSRRRSQTLPEGAMPGVAASAGAYWLRQFRQHQADQQQQVGASGHVELEETV